MNPPIQISTMSKHVSFASHRVVDIAAILSLPAKQQPEWFAHPKLAAVVDELTKLPSIVNFDTIEILRDRLAVASMGDAFVIQAGDCAEDPADSTLHSAAQKVGVVQSIANMLQKSTGHPVIRVGRIGGQFAKPRSTDTETRIDGEELPIYRGHIINGPEQTTYARVHDPKRLLEGYRAATAVHQHLSRICPGPDEHIGSVYHLWTSHEALVLDYELPQIRDCSYGNYLASTHWPWIGNRTNQAESPHAMLLAGIANPVASKIGPQVDANALLALCEVLDPNREPGRLTLISRMGADSVGCRLPELVSAVRAAGHPVLWLCDPMHGNTVKTSGGYKTRYLSAIIAELREFVHVMQRQGISPGGLHLEVSATVVNECGDQGFVPLAEQYTSLCDPRLNIEQALTVVEAFAEAVQ